MLTWTNETTFKIILSLNVLQLNVLNNISMLCQLTSFDRINSDAAKIRGLFYTYVLLFFPFIVINTICYCLCLIAIEKSVVSWVNDADVPFCPDCGNKFNIRNRRHHCRLCGSIMCRKCMEFIPLPLARTYKREFMGIIEIRPYAMQ